MNSNQHLENLAEIRSLMERSSRFISLSGLSGVAAGTVALVGAAAAYAYLGIRPFEKGQLYYDAIRETRNWKMDAGDFFLLDAMAVLFLAFGLGVFFTTRKARRKGHRIWDALTRRLLLNLAIPLLTGGLFCLALLNYGLVGLVAPATLIFYGLALVNAGKYTLHDIWYLGVLEILLGLIGSFRPGYGLEIWAAGFGLLHIIYGVAMYYKYEAGEEKTKDTRNKLKDAPAASGPKH